MYSPDDQPTVIEQLSTVHSETNTSTVAVMEVPKEDVTKYGIIEGQKNANNLYDVTGVVEKPSPESAPSRMALPGRYVFSHKIFDYLADAKPGKNGEIQLTDSMTTLAKSDGLLATTFKAERYDAGDKLGFLVANIELALKRKELGADLKKYLKSRVTTL